LSFYVEIFKPYEHRCWPTTPKIVTWLQCRWRKKHDFEELCRSIFSLFSHFCNII